MALSVISLPFYLIYLAFVKCFSLVKQSFFLSFFLSCSTLPQPRTGYFLPLTSCHVESRIDPGIELAVPLVQNT